ncbi:acyl-CoA dehydrogenase [Acuticoccus sp.]|uniref:acyl-CoA dehydrogenase n=1 Tax=Acuticoccus sp. TaxID=1904378 RepID=UPI003B5283DE
MSRSLTLLAGAGWFVKALPRTYCGVGLGRGGVTARDGVDAFVALGEANLSLARIFEGHVNAVGLVLRHADDAVRQLLADAIHAGAVVGVWGADGDRPLAWDPSANALAGVKRYASGLGVVTHALAPCRDGEACQLVLADVGDPARADAAAWAMAGMRATASGTYVFDGMGHDRLSFVGPPDVYTVEPTFLGGVWRIAAVTLGGVFALMEAVRATLAERGRLDHPAQLARLGPVVWRAAAVREATVRAAACAEGDEGARAPERAVALSVAARLMAEEVGMEAIAAVERSVGLEHFADGARTGRIARDLSTYMRQAMPDALLQRAAAHMLMGDMRLAEL